MVAPEATFGENNTKFPPLSAGLFAISLIEQIEVEDGFDSALVLPDPDAILVHDGTDKKGEGVKCPLAKAVEIAFHHYPPSSVKHEAHKLTTQAMHETWKKEYRRLKERRRICPMFGTRAKLPRRKLAKTVNPKPFAKT